jgi:hypothetical protein
VHSTSPTASNRIGRRLNRNAGTDVSSAATNSSGGRIPIRMNSGSSRTTGNPSTCESSNPTTTSRIGASRPSRRASAETTTTIATRPTVCVRTSTLRA